MTKVYVLYDDRFDRMEPVAVFSRKEEALAIINDVAMFEWNGQYPLSFDMIEYDLDDHAGFRMMRPWRLAIYKESGEMSEVTTHARFCHPTEPGITEYDHSFVVISPISRDHAIKVAIEKREEWLRSQVHASTSSGA